MDIGANEEGTVGREQGVMVELSDGTFVQLAAFDRLDKHDSSATQKGTERVNCHTDVKFCQEEMQFLHDNFEPAESSTLPRSVIYNHYVRFCQRLKIDPPMNAASFGKLIRLVFAGVKTRRLGMRGNSKYHYHGLRIKENSWLTLIRDEDETAADKQVSGDYVEEGNANGGVEGGETPELTSLEKQHAQFLGDPSTAVMMYSSPLTIHDNELLPEALTAEHFTIFENMYREHCEDILIHVSRMQLKVLPDLWSSFWCKPQISSSEVSHDDYLSMETLHLVSAVESVQSFVKQIDYSLYSGLIDILIPDVLRPIPGTLTLVLRNFSKNLEGWMFRSLTGVAEGMIRAKMTAVNAFAQLLRRYTSLNHLAQAARIVLQNYSHITQMHTDLSNVDFAHVQEQASWVCECDDILVYQLEAEIKKTLVQRLSLEEWAAWLDNISNHILQEHIGSPDFARAARQFLLKWSFYSSLVLRDLTLRSAPSFGSFHLIRLFFDEYVFYSVEHKVAAATGVSPVAAFGDIKQFVDRSSIPPLDLFSREQYRLPPESRFTFSSFASTPPNQTTTFAKPSTAGYTLTASATSGTITASSAANRRSAADGSSSSVSSEDMLTLHGMV